MAGSAAGTAPQFYPGSMVVQPTPGEQAGWAQRFNYANQIFGGPESPFGTAITGLSDLIGGGGVPGGMADALGPQATEALSAGFAGPRPSIGQYGFDPTLNVGGFTPQFGTAGGLDARSALGGMLSGTPDYAGAQGAIEAANAPLVRQFQEQILPSLNERATFLNNPTGGYKTLSRVLPELGQRMSQNALGVMEGERQRALASRERAANLISQGGLQGYGLGLQGAGMQADLGRSAAEFGLGTDVARAGAEGDWRRQLLGLGGLAGQLGQGATSAQLGGLGMFPQIAQAGMMPGDITSAYGGFERGLAEQGLQEQINRFNFEQQTPWMQAERYANLLQPFGGVGGTTTTKQPKTGSTFGSILGPALMLGSMFMGGLPGLAVGALGGLSGGGGGGGMLRGVM